MAATIDSVTVETSTNDPRTRAAIARKLVAETGSAFIPRFAADSAWSSLLGEWFGEAVPQYQGELVRAVRPDPAMERFAISASNTKELAPHTENFEYPGPPPRYIALYCRQAAEAGGETTLYDSTDLLEHLGVDIVKQLRTTSFEWRSPGSLASEGVQVSARHAAVDECAGARLVRFSAREMYPLSDATAGADGLLKTYRAAGLDRFAAQHLPVLLQPTDVLVWDNWRQIHSRNSFTGANRHLERVMFG